MLHYSPLDTTHFLQAPERVGEVANTFVADHVMVECGQGEFMDMSTNPINFEADRNQYTE